LGVFGLSGGQGGAKISEPTGNSRRAGLDSIALTRSRTTKVCSSINWIKQQEIRYVRLDPSPEWLITGEEVSEDRVATAEFEPDQLESLMVAAFELLGKPEAQAQELARSILKAAERPQSGDRGPPDRDPTPRLV
jgi:hypothetical protein